MVFICSLGCFAECSHHLPCEIFFFDDKHKHPTKRGLREHFAYDGDTGMGHVWRGEKGRGRCEITDPAESEG